MSHREVVLPLPTRLRSNGRLPRRNDWYDADLHAAQAPRPRCSEDTEALAAPIAGAMRPVRQTGLVRGTLILTGTGLRPVETLRRGDLVATLLPRGPFFVPVAWVGYRPAASHTGAVRPDRPVRIRPNAIADGMPATELLLAPEHGLYLGHSLYLARMLVNGASICWDRPAGPGRYYWGFRLEIPNVVLAQNVPVESLMPTGTADYVEVTDRAYAPPPARAAGPPALRLVEA